MSIEIYSIDGEFDSLSSLCAVPQVDSSSSTPVEDLIFNWFHPIEPISPLVSRVIMIDREPSAKEDTLRIGFGDDRGPIHACSIALDELMSIYGLSSFPRMPEEAFYMADKGEYCPDLEWIESRNNRLGIRWCKMLDEYVLPPRSLLLLLFSYCFSSLGMVRIEKQIAQDCNYRPRDVYRVEPIFLRNLKEEEPKSWTENLVIKKERLVNYIERRVK